MVRRGSNTWVFLLAVGVLASACRSTPASLRRDEGRLGTVRVTSGSRPTALVMMFSDRDGWTPALDAAARRLADGGAVVVGVDLPSYLRGLRQSVDGCHYVVAEIEDLSHRLERERGFPGYRSPVLAGIGAGATLAYAALAQAPAATIAGAAGVGRAPALATRVPLCAGATATPDPQGGFRYAPAAALPAPWYTADATPADAAAALATLVTPMLAPPPAGDTITAALPGLPLAVLPVTEPGTLAAIVYSGDGGWRDLDKTIGETLARRGVPVVGVDSLRYFWHARTPEGVAADLGAIMGACRAAWGDVRFALIGYSFGAGVLPFAVNRLTADDRDRVVEVSLLGLERRAPFEIEVTGWLGRAPSAGAPLVLPEIRRLGLDRLQCFYGREETESLCRDPALDGAEIVATAGGHHFDGDYVALAERVLAGARRRMAQRLTMPPTPPEIRAATSVSTKGRASPPGDAR